MRVIRYCEDYRIMQIKTTIVALIGLWAISIPAAMNKPIDNRSLLSQRSNNWSQGTIISFPNSTTFDNSTTRWSTYDAPSYLAAISPANEADVAKTVHSPIFRSREILMLRHRSDLHRLIGYPFSPLVDAMDTQLPWEIFKEAWPSI